MSVYESEYMCVHENIMQPTYREVEIKELLQVSLLIGPQKNTAVGENRDLCMFYKVLSLAWQFA